MPLSFILALKKINNKFVLNLWTTQFNLTTDQAKGGNLTELIPNADTAAAFIKTIGSRQVVFCNDGKLRIFKNEHGWKYEVTAETDHDKDSYRVKRESAARLYQNKPIRKLLLFHATKIEELFASKGTASTIDEWTRLLNNPPPNDSDSSVSITE